MFWKKKEKPNYIPAIIGGIVVLFLTWKWVTDVPLGERAAETTDQKVVQLITYGDWEPGGDREVLATIESDQEVEVRSEVSGTVESVMVQLGQQVYAGQALARLKTLNDTTQISYENALSQLDVTRLTTQNSVQSTEIALQSAKQELSQTRSAETQNKQRAVETLKIQAQNSDILITNTLNWLDRMLGATNRFRYDLVTGRSGIGAHQKIERQTLIGRVEKLVSAQGRLTSLGSDLKYREVLGFAQSRLDFLATTKSVATAYNDLIFRSRVSTDLTESTLSGYRTESGTYLDKLNAELLTLESQMQSTKSEIKRANLSVTSAENRVKTAQSQFSSAQTTADAQILAAENQLRLAQKSQRDLVIRAPIAGKIIEKNLSPGMQISVGNSSFMILNERAKRNVVAHLTEQEYEWVGEVETLKGTAQGKEFEVTKSLSSVKIDPGSQKIRVEFPLNCQKDCPLVGSFVKLSLPVNGIKHRLIPLSSLSFEPDGAEVLVINETQIAQRKKVAIGQIMDQAVEIVSGLNEGQQVVRYRNRVFSGEKVKSRE